VRQLRINLAELYSPNGRYDYASGWNAKAIAALIVGWIPPFIGLLYEPLSFLWGAGWFFSLVFAGLAYALFMRTDKSRLSAAEYAAITDVEPEARAPLQQSEQRVTI
jgi:NCS1 family nucleobase:cation symporter-1